MKEADNNLLPEIQKKKKTLRVIYYNIRQRRQVYLHFLGHGFEITPFVISLAR